MPTSIVDRNGFPLVDPYLTISRGVHPEVSHINKFGRNSAIASGATEDIWDGSATYVFPATALMTKISQTTDQAALQGELVEVQGLDADWELVVQNATLDGSDTTTAVTLATPLIRVFRMRVLSATVATSTIRVHNTAETQDYAVISTGEQQTLMAIYTIPAGCTGYLVSYYAYHNPVTNQDPTSNQTRLWAKDNVNGYAKQLKHTVGLPTGGGFEHFFLPYPSYQEKTDIFIDASPVGKAADVSAGFDIIIVDNDRIR